jgi:hypothetical protein
VCRCRKGWRETIKQDLGLDDGQLGLLQGLVFASLYSILGLPIGWLAERINRLPSSP